MTMLTDDSDGLDGVAVSLHLGAHKTATTYMQSVFALNADELTALGVAYIPLARMRSSVTRQVWSPSQENRTAARAEIRDRLAAVPAARRLVLSDENLIGTPPMDLAVGAFYPRTTAHLARLGELIGSADADVFLAVRSYDRFIPAMYAEVIRHREFLGFDEYAARVGVDSWSWRDVVAAICDVVSEDRLTLWQYEDFAALERSVLGAIIPETADVELEAPEDPVVRPSPSGRAIQALTALQRVLTTSEVQRLVGPMYEKVTDGPPFMPFDEGEAERLQSRYTSDLAMIEQLYPGIRSLRPDGRRPQTSPGSMIEQGRRESPQGPVSSA